MSAPPSFFDQVQPEQKSFFDDVQPPPATTSGPFSQGFQTGTANVARQIGSIAPEAVKRLDPTGLLENAGGPVPTTPDVNVWDKIKRGLGMALPTGVEAVLAAMSGGELAFAGSSAAVALSALPADATPRQKLRAVADGITSAMTMGAAGRLAPAGRLAQGAA